VEVTQRVVGCVLGLALGDALGAPFEFVRGPEIPDPLPAFERPWMGLPPGSTTDDTAMARNLVRSLVERDGFDAADLVARHLAWFRSGPPDVGSMTARVLQRASEGMPAEVAAEAIWRLRGPEVSAGNGSVMYCAPLGAAYAARPDALPRLAPRLSRITHYDGRCGTAVLAVTLAVAALVRGDEPVAAARAALRAVIDAPGGEELEFLTEAVGVSRRVDGPEQGFCLYAAAAGLQALVRDEDFETSLRGVVALGGDTDTNAAVAGALIGTRVGSEGLPPAWLGRLAGRDAIAEEAAGLAPLARRTDAD
jgi:ADP-ribosyl-[dinitrogen reductase] hydrolase